MKNRILTHKLHDHVGKEVTLAGWVDTRRDHGKLIFIDLRDAGGKVQSVVHAKNEEVHAAADPLRPEWVTQAPGTAATRPDNMVNPEEENGDIEISITALTVLSEAETPPFETGSDGYEVSEELRMKYRYLDIRRPRMKKNLSNRYHVMSLIRQTLEEQGFIEIETPILTKSTPEGARDYVVPSRMYPGKFYALPQAPQQFKQLLMVGGVEKYFQIARVFRDEDTRKDRQAEFTQLDIDMAFPTQDEILHILERLYTNVVKTLYPHKKIQNEPWPRITYAEAMKEYGTDRPDMRKDPHDPDELAFVWVIDFPLFEEEKNHAGYYAPNHHMFTAPKEEDIEKLNTDPTSVLSYQHDLALNGYEIAGGSIRIHDSEVQRTIFDLIGFDKTEQKNFEHMLEAFRYGVPPHGGIAQGLDRFLAIVEDEDNIREVIPFPKTGEGRDLMMDAPAEISHEQLDELHISVEKPENDHETGE